MNLFSVSPMFAEAAQQPGLQDLLRTPLVPLIAIMVVFIYISHRSQKKKLQEHDALLKSLRRGDKVLTGSGIVGTVVSVTDKTISIRSADTKLEVLKSAVSEVTERGAESKES